MPINLNAFAGGAAGGGGYKTISYSAPTILSVSISASSPTKITPPKGCRLRILLLADGANTSSASAGSQHKYKVAKLGAQTILNASQYLTESKREVGSNYLWYGAQTRTATQRLYSSSRFNFAPMTFISSLGCPVGGIDEPFTIYCTSGNAADRKIYLSYEVIKDE